MSTPIPYVAARQSTAGGPIATQEVDARPAAGAPVSGIPLRQAGPVATPTVEMDAGSARDGDGLEARVWRALNAVLDPEIPAVSVVDMGMIERVEVDRGRARVVVLPTFTGCPAVPVIEKDVLTAVAAVEGVDAAEVEFTFTPPWTTDRITAEGREKLREFGLAPPTGEGPVLITEIGLPARATCPFCGSTDTRAENPFGPTPCRALYYCSTCSNPFEQFKPV